MIKNTALKIALLLFLVPSISATRAAVDAEDYVEIEQGATELLTILESLPYASEGKGPVVYVFEFSECPYCQTMYRDFQGQDLGFEFRRFFVPVSDRSALEAAALGKSRDIGDYHAFMKGQKVAPAIDYDNDAIDVHNAILTAAGQDIPPILKRNGWDARGLVYPAYIWFEGGKVFANGGYLKANFERAMERAEAGWNEESLALLASVGGASGMAVENLESVATESFEPVGGGGLDIIGLRLGMSKDQAVGIIRAHDPGLRIQEGMTQIVRSDSRRVVMEFGEYLSEIMAYKLRGDEGFDPTVEAADSFTLVFSGPPTEQKLLLIARKLQYPIGKGPSKDVVDSAIAEKYGAPGFTTEQDPAYTQLWRFDDTPITEADLKQYLAFINQQATNTSHAGIFYQRLPSYSAGSHLPGGAIGSALSVMVVTHSQNVWVLYSVLAESLVDIGRIKLATTEMTNDLLAEHEAEMLEKAKGRSGPKL